MTKEEILTVFENKGNYTWHLYFFSVNKRENNPYKFQKIKMIGTNNIVLYAHNLISNIYSYIDSQITEISAYTGDNSNLTCEFLTLDNSLISSEWDKLLRGIMAATDEKLDKKIKGYLIEGKLKNGLDGPSSISFIKLADPSISLKDKNSIVFRKADVQDDDFTLKEMNELMYRLYLTSDMFTIDHEMFVLNYKFEAFFNLEKTFEKIKNEKVELILAAETLEGEVFTNYLNRYPSHKTFLTFNHEKFEKLNNVEDRVLIAGKYKFNLDANGNITPLNDEEAKRLIHYLCNKMIEDGDTNDILQVRGANKIIL